MAMFGYCATFCSPSILMYYQPMLANHKLKPLVCIVTWLSTLVILAQIIG